MCDRKIGFGMTSGLRLLRSEIPAKRVRLEASFSAAIPSDFFSVRCDKLSRAVTAIFADKIGDLSPEDLYQSCAELVNQEMDAQLLAEFSSRWKSEISSFFSSMETHGLSEISRNFRLLLERRRQVRSVFLPLDRKLVLKKFPTLDHFMISIGRDQFPPSFATSLLAVSLDAISGEISDFLSFLKELNLYDSFVSRYLSVLRTRLSQKESEISSLALGNLIDEIRQELENENFRPLDPETLKTSRKIVLEILAAPCLETGLGKYPLLEISDQQLKLAHDWTVEISGEQLFSDSLARNLSEILVKESEISKIDRIRVQLSSRLTPLVPSAPKLLKEALERRLRDEQSAKLLAAEIDRKFRGASDAEDTGAGLFKFLGSKDVFEFEHRKFLGKRILEGKERKSGGEIEMINLMKEECGGGFVSKLETMLKDKTVSTEISEGRNFQVFVLTTGVWPSVTAPVPERKIKWPEEISDQMKQFTELYGQRFQRRSLQWVASAGSCVLKTTFGDRKKEVRASVRQGLVLLLFNERSEISTEEISDLTGLTDVGSLLTSLARSGAIVLQDARWVLATKGGGFDDAARKVVELVEEVPENPEEAAKREEISDQRLREERMHSVDAAIVRIMKNRKSLTMNTLLEEIGNFLSFPINTADVKKRVEGLIEREFIERDVSDQSRLHYLA